MMLDVTPRHLTCPGRDWSIELDFDSKGKHFHTCLFSYPHLYSLIHTSILLGRPPRVRMVEKPDPNMSHLLTEVGPRLESMLNNQ